MADGTLLGIRIYTPVSSGEVRHNRYYYEPWHYRYVGKDAAKEITEQGITLEEYLGQ